MPMSVAHVKVDPTKLYLEALQGYVPEQQFEAFRDLFLVYNAFVLDSVDQDDDTPAYVEDMIKDFVIYLQDKKLIEQLLQK